MDSPVSIISSISSRLDKQEFRALHEEMSFEQYLNRVYENPKLIRTAYQKIYDMIISKGSYKVEKFKKSLTHYNFFDDAEIPIFGLEETLDGLVNFIKGAAGNYGTEKRVLLLHGPVGSSKSTICRRIKRGLESYSRTPEGSWYTFKWVDLPTGQDGIYISKEDVCPMHEEPLKLIALKERRRIIGELNEIHRKQAPDDRKADLYNLVCETELCPRCKLFMEKLMVKYNADWEMVVSKHIRVVRRVCSEADRVGIATFQPKDEKNQDATELTGDIDYSKLPHYGSDSDARAFNFDGEFCVGNRGMVEFIEMLKLAQEFLYDLLGATQERQIKPKKFAQISIDEAIFGHTNGPEYDRLKGNMYMEALKDRTVKIDVPYLLCWDDEIKVLEQDYANGKVRQHVAPHTLEVAALWAVLTRLQDDKDGKLTPVQKVRLYNGESLTSHTEDTVREIKDRYPDEGMRRGMSARYIQDKISNCLSNNHEYINPFMVMNEIGKGLDSHSLISNKEDLSRYHTCIELAIKELNEILKSEVQKALTGDEKVIERLCANYIDNVMAYIKKARIRNKITGRDEQPNERLMRSIEEKIDVPQQGVDDFRRMIAAFIGDMAHEGKQFKWNSNAELKKALEAKLFADIKHHIKLSQLSAEGATVVQPELQEKIDAIKHRLITQYGYNDKSATDVLEYVGSLYSSEEADEK